MKKACIDVGSNSILLLIEEKGQDGWKTLHDLSTVTGLGEAVKATGSLSEEAMTRSLDVLKEYFQIAHGEGCPDITAAGTMAVRMAANQAEFLDRTRRQGTPVEVLSGENEARLGLESVIYDPLFANQDHFAVIDPGGQSTEISLARKQENGYEIAFSKSFPVGTLGLRSNFIPSPQPSSEERFRAMMEADQFRSITEAAQQFGQERRVTAVALGASATNLASLQLQLHDWEPERVHGFHLTFPQISLLFNRLCDLDDEGRRILPGLEPGRERTIHIGALILERALSALDLKECFVSIRGWRYALLERGLGP